MNCIRFISDLQRSVSILHADMSACRIGEMSGRNESSVFIDAPSASTSRTGSSNALPMT